MRRGRSFFKVEEEEGGEESVLMGFEWNQMGFGCFKVFCVIFLVGTSMLVNSSVFLKYAHQELQNFYPKRSFAIAHKHACEVSYFLRVYLLTKELKLQNVITSSF